MIERRNTPVPATLEERGEGEQPDIVGRSAVFYDGTPETEFELAPGLFERIDPHAFDSTIAGDDEIVGLINHNPDLLIGRRSAGTLEMSRSAQGLDYRIKTGNTTAHRDAIESIRRGDLAGSSFSFAVTKQQFSRDNGRDIRTVLGARVVDMGPVTFPAYEATNTGLRSEGHLGDVLEQHKAWQEAQAHTESRLMKIKGFEA